MATSDMRSDDRELDDDTVIALFDHLFDPPKWMKRGRCVTLGLSVADDAAVLRACVDCPVRELCSDLADDLGITTGVYGGVNRATRGI